MRLDSHNLPLSIQTLNTKNFKWNIVSGAGVFILNLAIFLIIAKCLGAEGAGAFLFAQAIATPLALLASLRSQELIGTATHLPNIAKLYKIVLVISFTVLIVTTLFWLIFAELPIAVVGISVMLANLSQSISNIAQGKLIRLELFKWAAIFNLSRALFSGVVIGIALGIYKNPTIAYCGYALCYLLVTLFEFYYVSKIAFNNISTSENIDDISLADLLRYAASDSAAILQISFTRIVVSLKYGEAALAMFGTASMIVRLMLPISIALLRTFMPSNAEQAHDRNYSYFEKLISSIFKIVLAFTIFLSIIGYYLLPNLVSLVFSNSSSPSALMCAIIMCGAAPLIGSRFLTQILVTFRRKKYVEYSSWIPLATTVVCILPMTVSWQIEGIALSLTTGYCIRFYTSYYLSVKTINNEKRAL